MSIFCYHLGCFHCRLFCLRQTTYDFLIKQAEAKNAAKAGGGEFFYVPLHITRIVLTV
jgi:hypothetical protein